MIPTEAQLQEWQEITNAATGIRWEVQETPRLWMLFGFAWPPDRIEHGYQLIKAPKTGTPYAEYWPNAADSRFIITARTAMPILLEAYAQARQDLASSEAEVARLRAGIAGLRREHETHTRYVDDGDGYVDEMQEMCPAERGLVPGRCICGAAEHNAKVDALLQAPTP